ncbi:MAG: GTPase Era, partial [Alphaproteobacteria bacterium]|nr:GTPase Era [Alphaproteobacteria bacterium]
MSTPPTRCGTVAIIGDANAGKSTLLNALLGQKVSIVSPKAQTTRTRVRGILTQDADQIVFIDTPGLVKPDTRLQRAMVSAVHEALAGVDMIIHLVDATRKSVLSRAQSVWEALPRDAPVLLVLNKVDLMPKPRLLELAASFNAHYPYEAIFMIAALKNDGLNGLLSDIRARLPLGPWLYDQEEITDTPVRVMAAEITREKIFQQLHEEVPYACIVETELWDRDDVGKLNIHQTIIVRRDTQKAIVLGKGGSRIKEIGQQARKDIEELLQEKIFLKLFVKVIEDWPEKAEFYNALGL